MYWRLFTLLERIFMLSPSYDASVVGHAGMSRAAASAARAASCPRSVRAPPSADRDPSASLCGRHRRQDDRGDRPGELPAHGPGEDGPARLRPPAGAVRLCGGAHPQTLPDADRWRAVDAAALHGTAHVSVLPHTLHGTAYVSVSLNALHGMAHVTCLFCRTQAPARLASLLIPCVWLFCHW